MKSTFEWKVILKMFLGGYCETAEISVREEIKIKSWKVKTQKKQKQNIFKTFQKRIKFVYRYTIF